VTASGALTGALTGAHGTARAGGTPVQPFTWDRLVARAAGARPPAAHPARPTARLDRRSRPGTSATTRRVWAGAV